MSIEKLQRSQKKIRMSLPLTFILVAALTLCNGRWSVEASRESRGPVQQQQQGPAGNRQVCRCVPDQWEGVLSSIEREFDMKDGKTDTMESNIRVHYDFTNRKFSMTSLTTGKKALADYTMGVKYIISGERCYQIASDEVMQKMCLPDEAEFLGQYVLGTNIPVGLWQINNSQFNLTTRTTVVQENCIPISEEIFMSKGAYASLTNSVYLDVSLGIRDGSVFSAPPNCIQLQDEEEPINETAQQEKKRANSFSEAIRSHLAN